MTAMGSSNAEHGASTPLSPRRAAACDVAIFMAVREETVEVRRRIRPHLQGGDGRMHGEWRGRRVRLQEAGPGPTRAAREARRMLDAVRPRLVICAGVAGGLDPALRRGDVVVAERVIDPHGECSLSCDAQAVEVASLLGATRATLLTMPKVVCAVDEKRALSERAGLVDMESLAVARVADEHGVPFVAIRVISDAAHEGFPVDMNRYFDARGDIRRGALALAALRRPGGLGFLLGLRATTMRASATLASFLERVLDSIRFAP